MSTAPTNNEKLNSPNSEPVSQKHPVSQAEHNGLGVKPASEYTTSSGNPVSEDMLRSREEARDVSQTEQQDV